MPNHPFVTADVVVRIDLNFHGFSPC
jgi:hypothetical protein